GRRGSHERRERRHRAGRRPRPRPRRRPAQRHARLERRAPRLRKPRRGRRARARNARDGARRPRVALPVLMSLLLLFACKPPIIEAGSLAVTALSPGDEATDVAVDAAIRATFNEPLVADTIGAGTVSLVTNDGAPQALDVSYDATRNAITATPVESL